jgi:hypothetical protein
VAAAVAVFVGALAITAGLSSRAGVGQAGLGAFEGSWKLTEALRSGVQVGDLAAYEIVLTIQPDGLSGSGPCNRYRLVADLVLLDPTTMTVAVRMSSRTAMSCGPLIDQHDTLYFTALTEIDIGRLDPTHRELRLRGGAWELVLERIRGAEEFVELSRGPAIRSP